MFFSRPVRLHHAAISIELVTVFDRINFQFDGNNKLFRLYRNQKVNTPPLPPHLNVRQVGEMDL